MTQDSRRSGAGTVTALRRPPVRGWERLTEEQLARDCALPGGYAGGAYREGWARILGCLVAEAGGQA